MLKESLIRIPVVHLRPLRTAHNNQPQPAEETLPGLHPVLTASHSEPDHPSGAGTSAPAARAPTAPAEPDAPAASPAFAAPDAGPAPAAGAVPAAGAAPAAVLGAQPEDGPLDAPPLGFMPEVLSEGGGKDTAPPGIAALENHVSSTLPDDQLRKLASLQDDPAAGALTPGMVETSDLERSAEHAWQLGTLQAPPAVAINVSNAPGPGSGSPGRRTAMLQAVATGLPQTGGGVLQPIQGHGPEGAAGSTERRAQQDPTSMLDGENAAPTGISVADTMVLTSIEHPPVAPPGPPAPEEQPRSPPPTIMEVENRDPLRRQLQIVDWMLDTAPAYDHIAYNADVRAEVAVLLEHFKSRKLVTTGTPAVWNLTSSAVASRFAAEGAKHTTIGRSPIIPDDLIECVLFTAKPLALLAESFEVCPC